MPYEYHDIHIIAAGEPDVGINSIHETLSRIFLPDLDMKEERERVRTIFKDAFGQLWDDKVGVYFEDECPDCGRLKLNCVCPGGKQ